MPIVDMDGEVPAGTVVIVIDVIRAFTTAAVAFERGVSAIVCVPSVDAARELRRRHPEWLLAGESGGLKPADFDLGNSPYEMSIAPVEGRCLIQATSNGTRGLVRYPDPAALLAVSARNVGATARWVAQNHPGVPCTLVCTGRTAEDRACARYLSGLLGEAESPRALRGPAEQRRTANEQTKSRRAEGDRAGARRAAGDRAGASRAAGDRAGASRAAGDRAGAGREELVAGIRAGAAEQRRRAARLPVAERVDLGLDLPFCCDVDGSGFAMVGEIRGGHVVLGRVVC